METLIKENKKLFFPPLVKEVEGDEKKVLSSIQEKLSKFPGFQQRKR